MCQLAAVSRAGFYRSLQEQEPVEEDMEVRSAIQRIFAEHQRRHGLSAGERGTATPRHASITVLETGELVQLAA
jgi:hypothetical protein